MRFRLLATLFAVVVFAAGCGGSSTPSGSVTGNGYIRFLNGSPDQTAMDIDLPAGTRYKGDLVTGVLTPYQTIPAGTYSIGATPVGSTNAFTYTYDGVQYSTTNNSFVISPGRRYTVVLGGSHYSNNLTLCTFTEPAFTTAATSAAVQFNNCAPTYSGTTGTITVGYEPTTAASPVPVPLTEIALESNSGALALPATVASKGILFYASSPVVSSLFPSALDSSDTGNVLPFNGADQNVSIFVLDGAVGTSDLSLVGALDPDN